MKVGLQAEKINFSGFPGTSGRVSGVRNTTGASGEVEVAKILKKR